MGDVGFTEDVAARGAMEIRIPLGRGGLWMFWVYGWLARKVFVLDNIGALSVDQVH